MAAAQTEYSPWTGIKPGTPQMQAVTGSALGGAEQGALSGAMFSKQFNKPEVPPDQRFAATATETPPMGGGMSPFQRPKLYGGP